MPRGRKAPASASAQTALDLEEAPACAKPRRASAPSGAGQLKPATIEIFTDGACEGNPGPGGWGVLIVDGGRLRELSGGESATTNNRMELMAAIEGLKATRDAPLARLSTDSQYVKNGITVWIRAWKKNGWRTADKKPVKNQDLWVALDAVATGRRVEWRWIRGHSGHEGNERADALARDAIAHLKRRR